MTRDAPTETEMLVEIRRKVQEGIDQADRGEAVPLDQALVDRIKTEGRKRQRKSTPP